MGLNDYLVNRSPWRQHKRSLRLVGQVLIDFKLPCWYCLLPPAHIMQLLKNNVLLSVLQLSLTLPGVSSRKCVQNQTLCLKKKKGKIKFSVHTIGYNVIFDFTTTAIYMWKKCEILMILVLAGYTEGNSTQCYCCHSVWTGCIII